MRRRGRQSQYVCLAAAVLMLIGYVAIVIGVSGGEHLAWLTTTGLGVLIAGAILAVIGCIGLLLYRGFGYVWARHDFQETAITELSLRVQQLSERLNQRSRDS